MNKSDGLENLKNCKVDKAGDENWTPVLALKINPKIKQLLFQGVAKVELLARSLLYYNSIMAYYPRYEILADGCTFHLTWLFHDKKWIFKHEWAKRAYYDLLLKYKDKYRIKIYSYNFMYSHPHLTGYMETLEEFSSFFRTVHTLFAKIINKQLKRRGQVIMDRFRSPRIEGNEDHLTVIIYGDLNQVRAKTLDHPGKHKWSSYKYYAHGKKDPLITPAPCYLELGASANTRQIRYRERVEYILKHEAMEKRKYSTQVFIGNPEWVEKKYCYLREVMRFKRQAYLLRQQKQLAHHY